MSDSERDTVEDYTIKEVSVRKQIGWRAEDLYKLSGPMAVYKPFKDLTVEEQEKWLRIATVHIGKEIEQADGLSIDKYRQKKYSTKRDINQIHFFIYSFLVSTVIVFIIVTIVTKK